MLFVAQHKHSSIQQTKQSPATSILKKYIHKIFLLLKWIISNPKMYPLCRPWLNSIRERLYISHGHFCITFNRQKTYTHILLNILTLKDLKMVIGCCWLRLCLMNMLMNLSVPQKVGNFLTSRVTTDISKRILLHGIYMVPFVLNYISRIYIYYTTCLWNSYLKNNIVYRNFHPYLYSATLPTCFSMAVADDMP